MINMANTIVKKINRTKDYASNVLAWINGQFEIKLFLIWHRKLGLALPIPVAIFFGGEIGYCLEMANRTTHIYA